MTEPPPSPTDDDVLAAYPRAGVDHDNLELYRALLQRRLVVNRCGDCGFWHHPPRSRCPRCWSEAVEPTESPGTGTVYMFTAISSPDGTEKVMVTVDLDDQPSLRFTAPLFESGADDIQIGQRVEIAWLDLQGVPVPAFRTRS